MNPLSSPFANVNPNQQVIYAYAFDNSSDCEQIVELELLVFPSPTT